MVYFISSKVLKAASPIAIIWAFKKSISNIQGGLTKCFQTSPINIKIGTIKDENLLNKITWTNHSIWLILKDCYIVQCKALHRVYIHGCILCLLLTSWGMHSPFFLFSFWRSHFDWLITNIFKQLATQT